MGEDPGSKRLSKIVENIEKDFHRVLSKNNGHNGGGGGGDSSGIRCFSRYFFSVKLNRNSIYVRQNFGGK